MADPHHHPPGDGPTPAPALSVVIPNRDGMRWLEPCLASLAAGTRPPDEVIVADDGSTDASAAVAAGRGARFLPALPGPPGRGFAVTTNRGLAAARGDWILLLNNDTEVAPDALAALLAATDRHPEAAILAPLVRSLRDRRSIDSAGLLLYPDGVARPRWHGLPDPPAPLREEPILLPSGAACLIRADWLRRVGPLDESLGSYLEDVDWALRARALGARALFVPSALVYHHFSGTAGALSALKARRIERNRVVVAARHLPVPALLASPVWTMARWLLLTGARDPSGAAREPTLRMAAAVLGGAASGLARLPGELRARRRRPPAPVRGREWRALLRAHRAGPGDLRRFGA